VDYIDIRQAYTDTSWASMEKKTVKNVEPAEEMGGCIRGKHRKILLGQHRKILLGQHRKNTKNKMLDQHRKKIVKILDQQCKQ